MFYYQSLEFFKMCIFVKKYVEENKVNLSIIEKTVRVRKCMILKRYFSKTIWQKLLNEFR